MSQRFNARRSLLAALPMTLFATAFALLTLVGSPSNGAILSSHSYVVVNLPIVPQSQSVESLGPGSAAAAFPINGGSAQAFTDLDGSSFLHAAASTLNGAAFADAYWRDVATVIGVPPSFIRLNFEVEATLELTGAITSNPHFGINTSTAPEDPHWYRVALFSQTGEADLISVFHGPLPELRVIGFDSAIVTANSLAPLAPSFSITATFHIDAPYRPDMGGYYWAVHLFTGTGQVAGGSASVSSLHSVALQSISGPDGNPLAVAFDSGLQLQAAAVPEPASLTLWGLAALGCAVAGYRRRKSQAFSRFLGFVAVLWLSLSFPSDSEAAILIDFEDATPVFLPTSYHGFTWSGGSGASTWVVDLESSDIFSGTEAHSQDHYVYSNAGTNLSISDDSPFTFNSMWARLGSGSGTAIAQGFLGSTELFRQTIHLTDSYQLFALNFAGIDRWTLTNLPGRNSVLIDDISLSPDAVAAVPEPASLTLWGLAALGCAIGTCRRRKAA